MRRPRSGRSFHEYDGEETCAPTYVRCRRWANRDRPLEWARTAPGCPSGLGFGTKPRPPGSAVEGVPQHVEVGVAAGVHDRDRRPATRSFSASSPARASEPAGSARLWVQRYISAIASAACSSLTRTIRAAPATIAATASGSGVRHATPSTNVSARSVVDRLPGLEGQGVRRRVLGHDAHDLGVQPEQVADRDVARRCRCPSRPARRPTSRSGTASCSSAAYVATPSTSHGWNGGDHQQPALLGERRGVLDATPGSRRRARPARAPSASVAAFLSGELPSGTTIVTGTPCARPAKARLWLWLPRLAETSPAGASAGRRAAGRRSSGRRAP